MVSLPLCCRKKVNIAAGEDTGDARVCSRKDLVSLRPSPAARQSKVPQRPWKCLGLIAISDRGNEGLFTN